jgi:cell division protein FtsN
VPKDLKHRVPGYKPQPKRRAGWFTFLVIAVCLGLIMVVGLKHLAAGSKPEMAFQAQTSEDQAHSEKQTETPSFRFFKLLPDSERLIPDSDITAEKRKVALGKSPTPGVFYLQVGAFTERLPAEQLRALLTRLVNQRVKLELIKLEHTAWYRVSLGPYKTISDAEAVRSYLADHQQDSVIQEPLN